MHKFINKYIRRVISLFYYQNRDEVTLGTNYRKYEYLKKHICSYYLIYIYTYYKIWFINQIN